MPVTNERRAIKWLSFACIIVGGVLISAAIPGPHWRGIVAGFAIVLTSSGVAMSHDLIDTKGRP